MRKRLPPLCLTLFVLDTATSGGCGGKSSLRTTATGSVSVATTTGETGEGAPPPEAFTFIEGPWSLRFAVPKPDVSAFPMFGEPIQGTYDQIGKVHLSTESELKWKMQSEAPLMSAKLVGYGDAQGTEQFLGVQGGNGAGFAPGTRGFRSDAAMPAGDYLPRRRRRRPVDRHV